MALSRRQHYKHGIYSSVRKACECVCVCVSDKLIFYLHTAYRDIKKEYFHVGAKALEQLAISRTVSFGSTHLDRGEFRW